MIQNSRNFMFPEKNVFSEAEESFKALLKSNMNMDIIQTLCCYAAYGQMCIFLWCSADTYQSYYAQNKEAQRVKSKSIIDAYLECFEIKDIKPGNTIIKIKDDSNSIENIVLYIRDFRAELISYAYGNALLAIREEIGKMYTHSQNVKVYLDYARTEYLIECDEPILGKVKNNEDKIKDIIYHALKEHDHYGVVAPSDIRARISAYSPQNNDIHMTNRWI